MGRYTPFLGWVDKPDLSTPVTAARLIALETGAAADVPVGDIDATGTPSSSTYLRGDGTWATPSGGVTDLEGLSDVDLTSPADRDVLRFNSTGSQWENEPLSVDVSELDATGTPSSSTYLRGDGTWSTPSGGGGGAVDSVNGQVGTVSLDQDDIGDGTTYKQYSATEKTKLAGIATGATANDTDSNLKNRANHTGTQTADTITDGTTNKAYTATEKTKLAGVATGATANDTDANLKARANHTGTQTASTISDFSTAADARIAAVVRYTVPFSKGGTLTTGTGTFRWYNRTGATRTIQTVTASVGTQPTGAAVIVDVNKNGTTIFTTQSNRPQIAVSTNEDESGTPDVTSLAVGDYLTIDIDQIGSTVAGADLVVTVVYS